MHNFNPFKHDVEKWTNILYISCGVNARDFESMSGHFSTLCMIGLKILSYNMNQISNI